MEANGKLCRCDYPGCDAWCFCETTGEGEADGGFTRWNKFEQMPKGWGKPIGDGKLLCPKHYAEREKVVQNFYEKGQVRANTKLDI